MENGSTVKIICGEVNGTKGPVQDIVTDPEYLDVTVPAGETFNHYIENEKKAFAYVIGGEGYFDDSRDPYSHEVMGTKYFDLKQSCICGDETLVLFGDGDEVHISAIKNGVRFLLVSGKPIREPVAWYGPIVMNTRQELKIAFEEYENGTFIKHGDRTTLT